MKKVFSFLLALSMLLSLSVTTFAVDEGTDSTIILTYKGKANWVAPATLPQFPDQSPNTTVVVENEGSALGLLFHPVKENVSFTWKSDDEEILSVSPIGEVTVKADPNGILTWTDEVAYFSGELKPHKNGTAKITATASTGETVSVEVTVNLPTYTVIYRDDLNGTILYQDEVYQNRVNSLPQNPSREGKEFENWYYVSNSREKPFSTSTKLTKNGTIEVYAKWTPNKYTVTFVSDGADLSSAEYDYGTAAKDVTVPANPTKDGYTFTGWSPALAAVTGDVTYTAQFVENTPENTVTNNDGSTTTTVTVEDKTIETTVKTNGDTTTVETDAATGDKTTTTVTTDESSNTTTTVEQKTTTASVTSEADAAVGTFVVEKKTATSTTVKNSSGVVTSSTTTPATVDGTTTVTVQKAVSAATATTSAALEGNAAATAIVAAAKANEVTATNVKVEDLAKSIYDKVQADSSVNTDTANVEVKVALTLEPTLTAVETIDDEVTSLTFDVKPMMTATVKVGNAAAETYDLSEGEDGTSKVVDNSMLKGKITVKLPVPASFIPSEGFVSGTTAMQVKHTMEDNTIEILPGTIYREGTEGGYTYYVQFETESFSSFELIPAGKVFRTVTFDSNGGSAVASKAVADGTAVSAPTAPTRSGYSFNGWTLGGSAYNFSTPVTGDITLVAQWTQNSTGGYTGGGSYTPPTTTITDEETPLSAFPIFYVDVAQNAWYHDAIAYVTALDLMNGVGDDRFAPNANTPRGMVAVVMMRLAQGVAIDSESFFDVADDAYYAEAAAWAVENGVFVGYDDGSFRGEVNISREQFAAVLYRYALAKGYDVSGKADIDSFADSARVSGYAADAMAWAIETGIIDGIGDNLLDPTGNATRAQLATMLMRFSELTKDTV